MELILETENHKCYVGFNLEMIENHSKDGPKIMMVFISKELRPTTEEVEVLSEINNNYLCLYDCGMYEPKSYALNFMDMLLKREKVDFPWFAVAGIKKGSLKS